MCIRAKWLETGLLSTLEDSLDHSLWTEIEVLLGYSLGPMFLSYWKGGAAAQVGLVEAVTSWGRLRCGPELSPLTGLPIARMSADEHHV